MKRAIVCWGMVIVVGLGLNKAARADELSELKAQMEVMQKQLREQASQMEKMQKKIGVLEAQRQVSAKTPEGIEDKVAALEEKTKKPYESGLLSLKGEKWEIGGELEFEFVKTKKHASVDESEPHFQLDKFVLKPKVYPADDVFLLAEIEFGRTSVEVKKAFLQFDGLPFDSYLKAGIDERFMAVSRKTERYPLVGNAFWRDSEAGIFAGGKITPLYWRASYTSGLELDDRSITEDNSLLMIHDDRRTSNYASPGEGGLGLGFKKDFDSLGEIDILGFGYLSKLSGADENWLNTNVTGYNSSKRTQRRYGASLDYSLGHANIFAHFIEARDGDLDRYAWYLQPSYEIGLGEGKFFYAVEPLFRYGELCVENIDAVTNDSLTWDREEFTFGVITYIYKNIKLKTEYTIDRMDKDVGGTKDYSEFLAQLEVMF